MENDPDATRMLVYTDDIILFWIDIFTCMEDLFYTFDGKLFLHGKGKLYQHGASALYNQNVSQ